MSIIASELQIYLCTVNDTTPALNGGRLTTNLVTSGGIQNVFPHVFSAERTSGSSKYRKLNLKVSNDDDDTLYNPLLFLDRPTAGDDYVVMFEGTHDDTQATKTENKWYGVGMLHTAVTGGVTTTIVVDVADGCQMGGTTPIFADGDIIRITDKLNPDSLVGNEELLTITGTPTNGSQNPDGTYPVSCVVTAAPTNSYTTVDTRVSTVLEYDDVVAQMESGTWNETSSAGTYDESTYPVEGDNIGTIYDDWTIEFTDETNFTVTGATSGLIGTGDINTDVSIDNTTWGTGKKYFILRADGWGGTWAIGETVEFTTIPACIPMWERRVVPAGCDPIVNNRVVHVTTGEVM